MENMKCIECGWELQSGEKICKNCGCPVDLDIQEMSKQEVSGNKKTIGIIMCVMSLICCIFAFSRINNRDYDFYLEHYKVCIEGYQEAVKMAGSNSGYFKIAYENIAYEYEEMADEDYIEIWKLRVQLIIATSVGIILLVLGYDNIRINPLDTVKKSKVVIGLIILVVLVCVIWYQVDKKNLLELLR